MKYTRLFLICMMVLAMVLVACSSDSSSDDADEPVETEVSDNTVEPTPTQEAEELDTDAQTVDSDMFTVTVSGAYDATLPYVSYNYAEGAAGVYDLRFTLSDDEEVLGGDVILVLPADIATGTYALFNAGSPVPQANVGDLELFRASMFVNLFSDNLPFAMNNPMEGELTITENNGGALSGSFTITVGAEGEEITVTGELNGLNASVEP